MNDVAARAGVSRSLVSIVMRGSEGASDQTRARVLAAAEDLGYERNLDARLLRTGRSDLVGVVFDIRDAFHADLVEACYPAANARGRRLSLSAVTAERDQAAALAALVSQRVDGIVVLGARTPLEALAEVSAQVPLVVVGPMSRHGDGLENVAVVHTDERAGVRDALDHLFAHGHQDVACVEATGRPAGAERVFAYREVMTQHGYSDQVRVLTGAFTHEAGRLSAAALMADEHPLPTAVLAANDACAIGLVQTLRAAGVDVPGQVSVIGFDGSQLPLAPGLDLSTVVQDTRGLARLAVDVVGGTVDDDLQRRSEPAPEHVLRPHLRLGSTSGPVR